MSKTIDGKTQNPGVDEMPKYSLLRYNVKALLVLFFITVCGGAIAYLLYVIAFIQGNSIFGADFAELYRLAQVFVSGGDVFHVVGGGYLGYYSGQTLYYAYPPPSVYVFIPFTYLPFDQARIIWVAISVAALLLTILFITKILYHYGTRLSTLEILLISAALFLFEPIANNLYAANINLLLLFLTTAFYYLFFIQKRATGAGIVLGVAAIIKIWPLVFIFLDFLHKSKKMLVAAIATIGVIAIGTLWQLGTSFWVRWLAALSYHESAMLVASKDAVLAPPVWDSNASLTNAIIKVIVLFDLNVSTALQIVIISMIIFICGVFLFLFKTSKSEKDDTKLKEWEILSFTLLLISVLFVTSAFWSYYTSYFVLSFILIIFIVPLTFVEKVVLIISLVLFATRVWYMILFTHIGGIIKTLAYIIPAPLIAYVLFVALIIYVIRERTKSKYWTLPLSA